MDNRQKLQSGLKEMGLDLSGEQQDKLLAYVEMLKKWNKTYNLTALRDESQIISHHLLDSLTLPPYLEGQARRGFRRRAAGYSRRRLPPRFADYAFGCQHQKNFVSATGRD